MILLYHKSNSVILLSGLKVSRMTQTIWVTFWWVKWVSSHPQTKLSGCDPDIIYSLENSVGIWKWVNFGSDECIEISLVRNQLISNCFEACGVQRFHLQEVCERTIVLYPAKNEEIYGIVPYQNFFKNHIMLHYF